MNLKAFLTDHRHLGLFRASLRSLYYRVSAVTSLHVYRLCAVDMESVNRELLVRPMTYACRMLEADELKTLALDPANRIPPAFLTEALAKGDLCYGILDGDVLASYGWYSPSATTVEDWMTFHFNSQYLYMYHGYTKPEYRGQNLHGIGLVRALETACSLGYTGVVSLAEMVNYASLRSAYRSGYFNCGVAIKLGKGSRTRLWVTPGGRRFGIRMESAGKLLYENA